MPSRISYRWVISDRPWMVQLREERGARSIPAACHAEEELGFLGFGVAGLLPRPRTSPEKKVGSCAMEGEKDVKKAQTIEARARNISHNVRCTECGSQSIEDSQADIAILLRKMIRDEIRAGKTDKEIYKKLEDDFGETVLYTPKFDMQTAAIWLSPFLVAGAAAGIWAYQRHRQKTNVHIMALNLVRGVPLTPTEKQTMLDLLTPPPTPPKRRWWG